MMDDGETGFWESDALESDSFSFPALDFGEKTFGLSFSMFGFDGKGGGVDGFFTLRFRFWLLFDFGVGVTARLIGVDGWDEELCGFVVVVVVVVVANLLLFCAVDVGVDSWATGEDGRGLTLISCGCLISWVFERMEIGFVFAVKIGLISWVFDNGFAAPGGGGNGFDEDIFCQTK